MEPKDIKLAKTLYGMTFLNDKNQRNLNTKILIASKKNPGMAYKHLNTLEACFQLYELADRMVTELGLTDPNDVIQQFRSLGIGGLGLYAVAHCLHVVNDMNPHGYPMSKITDQDRDWFRKYIEAQPELCVFVESVLGAITIGEMKSVDHVSRIKDAYSAAELVPLTTDFN